MQKVKEYHLSPTLNHLSSRDYRRLLGISVFQKRERIHSRGLLMKIREGTYSESPPFIWFGDAWFADKLYPDQTIYCLPSGRIQIDQTENFVKAMAEHCLNEILAVQSEGPYLMGGFCFDAWIAYEVSQLLYEMGHETALLIMIECYTLDAQEGRFNAFMNHIKMLCTGSLKSRLDYIRLIAPWGAKEASFENIPLAQMSVADQVNLLTKIALQQYERLPTKQPIELIFGRDSWHSNYYKLGQLIPRFKTGWFKTALGDVTTFFSAGDHDTILEEPNVNMMAKRVQACIDHARAKI